MKTTSCGNEHSWQLPTLPQSTSGYRPGVVFRSKEWVGVCTLLVFAEASLAFEQCIGARAV